MNTALKTMKFFVLASVFAVTAQAQTAKRYIVIYKSQQGYTQMDNYMKLESASKPFKLSKSLKNIHMQVINASNAESIEQLKSHPEVEAVVEEITIPVPKFSRNIKISSTPLNVIHPLNANANPDSFNQTDGTPWGIVAVKAPGAWGLSDAGSKARVLIIDTGIDKNHEALSNQLEKAKNFTAGATGSVDPNNYADEVGHGTHCAGTVLGQYNDQTGFVGVAPKAKLLAAKVCTAKGCQTGDIVAGIDWGVEQKVDIMSMSLGMPGEVNTGKPFLDALATAALEFQNKPLKTALANAETAGVFIVAASGNSATEAVPATPTTPAAPAKNPKIGYPAKAATVYSVGAVDSTLTKTTFSQWGPELDISAPGAGVFSTVPMQSGRDSLVYLMIDGQKTKVKSVSFAGTKEITIPKLGSLVYAGLGKPDDFTKINVAGKFALIQRGEITFADKVKNAQAAKAAGVVVFNNAAGLAQGTLSEDGKTEIDYPVVMIEQAEGNKLVAQLTSGKAASAEVSTIKTNYALMDGTSMATPHVAGVAALVISTYKLTHGGQTMKPADVRALLSKTAMKLAPSTDNKYGAGLVQADKAVQAASK